MNKPKDDYKKMLDFIVVYINTTFVGKVLILYFGMNYSMHPGEGFGLGLVGSFVFSAVMIGRFLWKNRNYEY